MSHFFPADILLPKEDFEKWAVVACDQYTSEPEYWDDVERIVGDSPSALNIILPEVFLKKDNSRRIEKINKTMEQYIEDGVFEEHKNSMIYVERRAHGTTSSCASATSSATLRVRSRIPCRRARRIS